MSKLRSVIYTCNSEILMKSWAPCKFQWQSQKWLFGTWINLYHHKLKMINVILIHTITLWENNSFWRGETAIFFVANTASGKVPHLLNQLFSSWHPTSQPCKFPKSSASPSPPHVLCDRVLVQDMKISATSNLLILLIYVTIRKKKLFPSK